MWLLWCGGILCTLGLTVWVARASRDPIVLPLSRAHEAQLEHVRIPRKIYQYPPSAQRTVYADYARISLPEEQQAQFIRNSCPNRIWRAYQTFPPPVRTRLWGLCALLQHGGIYVDAESDLKPNYALYAFTQPRSWLVVALDARTRTMSPHIFAAPAYSPIVEHVIDVFLERKGDTTFTEAVESWLHTQRLPVFTSRRSRYLQYCNHTLHVLDDDRRWIRVN